MEIKDLIGKTLIKISVGEESTEILFYDNIGKIYKMYHEQNCCEKVYVEDICGEIEDLINSPITKASEDTNSKRNSYDVDDNEDMMKWTFYNIGTEKGSVTIRWYGESNGYYSVSVDMEEVKDNEVSKRI